MKLILIIFILISSVFSHAQIKKIKIGTEGAYEPFNYIDAKGNVQGFDIDITKALCKEMKFECEFITQSWDGIIPGLLLKKYDAIVASMSVTKKRKKKVLFTNSYYHSPSRFIVKINSNLKINKKALKDKNIGVQRGTVHYDFLKEEYKNIVNIKLYNTQEDANLDLLAGRLDAVLADTTVLYSWIQNYAKGKVKFIGPKFNDPKYFGDGAAIALRKSDKDLALKFNKALSKIFNNGIYDNIRKKYFPFDIR